LAQVQVADLQLIHVVLDERDRLLGTVLIAVPEQPLVPLAVVETPS